LRVGSRRTVGVSVRDETSLARLALRIDGRWLHAWTLTGRSASRTWTIPSRYLSVGWHRVRWTVRDRAGNVTSREVWLVVRRR
jgi:hypothetical protein